MEPKPVQKGLGNQQHKLTETHSPDSWVGSVWTDEQIVLLVGDEVHSAQVHCLVASVEANVAFFGLSSVARRPDYQPLDVVQNPLVFRIGIGHADDSSRLLARLKTQKQLQRPQLLCMIVVGLF